MGDEQLILGLSFDYHDAAAALVDDGVVLAAAAEERFSRRKHDPQVPSGVVEWLVDDFDLRSRPLRAIAFYSKPLTTLQRVLWAHGAAGPRSAVSLARALSSWGRSKIWVELRIEQLLTRLGVAMAPVVYAEHHQSHAAAAFYPSPFERAAVLTLDGVGEWATGTIGVGRGQRLSILREARFPDSLGLFYSAMTAFCGFEVNDGEYQLMGLAPYGSPVFEAALRDRAITVHEDGSVLLDQRCFRLDGAGSMTTRRIDDLLGGAPLSRGSAPTQREADIAASVQAIVEDAVLRSARTAHELTGERNLCLAGGVALNCVANRRLVEEGPFEHVWIQPAAGDDGAALGAALWCHHQVDGAARPGRSHDAMSGATLGPSFATTDVVRLLKEERVEHREYVDTTALCDDVAGRLADGALVGWFRGPMEYGPRGLGARSILADPRDAAAVGVLNERIKGRAGFRPFAPAVPEASASAWFDLDEPSPYMLRTAAVRSWEPSAGADVADTAFSVQLAGVASAIPACTHVDGSARVQTVSPADHPVFHELLEAFGRRTGVPVLVNTSFNRGGEPIVCTPADALRTARDAGLDVVVMEDCVVELGAREAS